MQKNEPSKNNLVHLNAPQPGQELSVSDPSSRIDLTQSNQQLDLSGLTTEQQQQLRIKHAEAMIGVTQKARDLAADAGALNHSLETLTHHTREVAASGQEVTITHTQDSALGRTEVIMGTSDAAKKGKLTGSQSGKTDHTYLFAGVIIFIVIIVALVAISK